MFLPNIKTISEIVSQNGIKQVGRAVRGLSADRDEREKMKEHFPELVDHLNKWIGDVGLFLLVTSFSTVRKNHQVNTEHDDELKKRFG